MVDFFIDRQRVHDISRVSVADASVIGGSVVGPVSCMSSMHRTCPLLSTDFERPSASSLNWRSSCTELLTALHLSTYRASFSTSLICRRDVEAGCARRPPVSLTSVRRDLLLSAIVRLLLPARDWNSLPVDVQSAPSLTTFRQ